MSAPQIIFVLSHIALLLSIVRKRAWRVLPVFSTYALLSLAVNLTPKHPEMKSWRESWWIWEQGVLLLGIVLVIIELILSVKPCLLRKEYRGLRIALISIPAATLPFVWVTDEKWGWFLYAVASRQYAQLALFLIVLGVCGYITAEEVHVSRLISWHGWVLCWFVLGQTLVRMMDPTTGLIAMPKNWWGALNTVSYLNAGASMLVWAMAFTKLPCLRAYPGGALCSWRGRRSCPPA